MLRGGMSPHSTINTAMGSLLLSLFAPPSLNLTTMLFYVLHVCQGALELEYGLV